MCKNVEIKCNNIIKQYKIINFKWLTKKNNPNRQQILHHPYGILIIGFSRSGKTNSLLNIISHKLDIDKIYLYPINMMKESIRESTGLKHFNDSKALLKTKIICMIFIKILKNIVWIKKIAKKRLYLMIWFLTCLAVTKLNEIVTEN